MKKLLRSFATVFVLCYAISAGAQTSMDYNILIEDLEFQPGVTIDINVNVYVNENAVNWNDHGKIFAVEGMIHTANCWKPFAESLFENGPQGVHINEFFAIDMPGRGGSGLPEGLNGAGMPFLLDQMYIEDFVHVIAGAISYLNSELDIHPNTIMGHSLGGIEVIVLQDMLVAQESNMRLEFGIKNAILLAPAIPAPLDWAFITGPGSDALAAYATYAPGIGLVLDVPYYVWPFLFFTNTCCYFPPQMVPGAPTPAEVMANGYCSIEAGPLVYQIAGREIPEGLPYPYKPRVTAAPDIFRPDHGVQLTIIADEFDKMMMPEEEWALYQYLTKDKHGKGFLMAEGEETCHDTHISDPDAIVALLNKPYFFKQGEVIATHESDNIEFAVYPNPASGQFVIQYNLQEDAFVNIRVYNLLGSEVAEIQQQNMIAGMYKVIADISSLRPGTYLLSLEAGELQRNLLLVIK